MVQGPIHFKTLQAVLGPDDNWHDVAVDRGKEVFFVCDLETGQFPASFNKISTAPFSLRDVFIVKGELCLQTVISAEISHPLADH